MTFEKLFKFLQEEMRMSHIYQPLLIRCLVDAGGSATLRQLAQSFLTQDESQLLYYEDRIKKMPVKVLKKRDVISKEGDLIKLNVKKLTLEQKAKLIATCEYKLQEFIQKRGIGIWDHRLLELDPVPDSVRYQVLKESDGRCALCGATKNDRPLDVDHIVPRNRGGKNEKSNLQVLCSKCNRSKRDKDDTDFRNGLASDREVGCVFCSKDVQRRVFKENRTVFAVEDKYPVTKSHLLVIPKRHAEDFFSMTSVERQDAEELIRVLRNKIIEEDDSVAGFNIGMNCNQAAGQTIMHAHIHLIPRRKGDVDDPRGGVRGVIAAKQKY